MSHSICFPQATHVTDIAVTSTVIRQISALEGHHKSQKLEKSPVKSGSPSQPQNTINRTGLHKCFAHLNLERQTAKLQQFPSGKYSSHLKTGRKT